LYGTNSEARPYFGLHDFRNKSFLVSALEGRQYLTLEGASDLFASPPSSVSHTFQNVNILLDNPGYYLFNNAVFVNVTISRNVRDKSLYHIVQRGMTIDFTSLYRFFEDGLLFPSSLYMLIDGGSRLRKIVIQGKTEIEVVGKFGSGEVSVPVALSRLTRPITIKTRRATEKRPLVIEWAAPEPWIGHVDAPQMRIDLTDVPGDDAFLVFTGRKWAGEYHNFSDSISVSHGQLNIHISSQKDEKGAFLGQPPHVELEGDGDYYINEVKQVSALSKGQHLDGVFGGDADRGSWGIPLLIGGALAVVGICFCWRTKPTKAPVAASVTHRENVSRKEEPEEQLEGSQFLNVEAELDHQ
jgi:hypothetical protein